MGQGGPKTNPGPTLGGETIQSIPVVQLGTLNDEGNQKEMGLTLPVPLMSKEVSFLQTEAEEGTLRGIKMIIGPLVYLKLKFT